MPGFLATNALKQLAEQCSRTFTLQQLAETSFISNARHKGFSTDAVYRVASMFWPNGHGSQMLSKT